MKKSIKLTSRAGVVAATAALVASLGFVSPMAGEFAPAVTGVVEAERSFARMASEKGIRDAFLAWLADDAIVFRPGPVDAKKWYAERPPSQGVLMWEPAFADISSSGDLGYDTGPWSFKNAQSDPEPVAYGHFVSIWRKQADGTWKVVLDTGCSHNKPRENPVGVTSGPISKMPRGKSVPHVDAKTAETSLAQADREFTAASLSKGLADAYKLFAADDVRYYPSNGMPLIGRESTLALLSTRVGVMTWEPTVARVAASGDLGYTYGMAHWKGTNSETNPRDPTEFSYTTIWRKSAEGAWKVALAISQPAPPHVPEAAPERKKP